MKLKMFRTILAGLSFLFAISCNPNLRNARCGSCTGPVLTIHLEPPVSEDIEIEIKSDKENFIRKCELLPQNIQLFDPEPRGNCEGELIKLEPSPSVPSASPSPLPRRITPLPTLTPYPSYRKVNFTKYTVNHFQANKIEVILRNFQGKVLGQQTFQLNFELNPSCGTEFKNCSEKEITLHLSKPTEPTPTPSNTPSP
ncbi:MAG: hypothetical protein IV090_24390 [Candidatus Sericytochromatia bacterium]|nr:hypothetical protein [Candidatus Sericytochromatia bacterium]